MKKILFIVLIAVGASACGESTLKKDKMKEFSATTLDRLNLNAPTLIDRGMLLTAGNDTSFNTMTISWGGLGRMWGKNVAFVFVRPQRYTMQFMEREKYFTLSIFSDEYSNVLQICGVLSGRNTNKMQETGLIPVRLSEGVVTFQQATTVVVCKKLYAAPFIDPEAFVANSDIVNNIYPNKDFHHMFVGEIVDVYTK